MSEQRAEPLDTGGMAYAPVGVGGWLLLPIFHLAANAGAVAYYMGVGFMKGYHARPTQSVGGAVHQGLKPSDIMLAGIGVFDIFFVAYALYCLHCLFRKKSDVPTLMILFYVMLIAKVAAYAYLLYLFPDARKTASSLRDAVFSAAVITIAGGIWIPYFMVSVRVKNTFVR